MTGQNSAPQAGGNPPNAPQAGEPPNNAPQAGGNPNNAPQAGDQHADDHDEYGDLTPEQLRAELRRTQRQKEAYRRRLRSLTGKDNKPASTANGRQGKPEADDPDVSELRQEVERLRAERRRLTIRDAIMTAGRAANARRPEALPRLVDDDEIDLDDDGSVTNADAIVRKLRREYPELFGRGGVNGGDGNDGGSLGGDDMNVRIRRGAGRG